MNFQARQGDIMIEAVTSKPQGLLLRKHGVLANGEKTGHKHRIAVPSHAKLWEAADGVLYMKVEVATEIVHDEHGPIAVAPGLYKVWVQREYHPTEIRRVTD